LVDEIFARGQVKRSGAAEADLGERDPFSVPGGPWWIGGKPGSAR